jgi:putative ABC transport system substrate-binding protein
MMRRRLILVLLAVVAALAPARAQTPEKTYRVAVLAPGRATAIMRTILAELGRQGFVEGRNLVVDVRLGRAEELAGFAREIVAAKPDAIFAVSPPAVRAAAAATNAVPIVILVSVDPVGAGWVESLARPGRNITGAMIMGPELDPKRLQLIHELVPSARRLAVLRDPAVTPDERRVAIEAGARDLGIAIDMFDARSVQEIAPALRRAHDAGAGAVNILASPLFSTEAEEVATAAIAARLPAMCHWREMVEAGCFASYGPTFVESYRIAGAQIGRILAGGHPAEMPVEQPTKFALVINAKTASALGIKVPPEIVAIADEVID